MHIHAPYLSTGHCIIGNVTALLIFAIQIGNRLCVKLAPITRTSLNPQSCIAFVNLNSMNEDSSSINPVILPNIFLAPQVTQVIGYNELGSSEKIPAGF